MQLDYKLAAMLREAAKLGAQEALIQAGLTKSHITKSHAYKIYGRVTVDRWVSSGVVQIYQDGPGAKCFISLADLAAVAASQSLVQYVNLDQLRR